jgi:vacuolar-type H+-ATPase subunit C/Vma6
VLTKIATDLDFVIAKTRAMHSALYEGDRLNVLLRHRTLPDLANELFPMETFASHMALERRLVEAFAESLARMWRYFGPPRDRLFTILAVRLQVENVKVLLRSYLSGRRGAAENLPVIPLPEPFDWPSFDVTVRLSNARDILDQIPEPLLRRAASEAFVLFTDNPVPLYLEAGLDQGWMRLLIEAWSELNANDREVLAPLVDLESDIHNLMFVLRARVNYQLDRGMVVRLAAGNTGHPSGPEAWVAEAAEGDSVREVLARAPLRYRRVLADVPPELPNLERRLWRLYYGTANRLYFRTFFSIGCPYAFAAVKRMELANLITVVEAIRYGMTIEQTLGRFLVPEA